MSLVDNIKKAAVGNNTKIQTTEAANLEKIFNRMFYEEKNPEEESAFVKQVITRGLDSQERVGLHASSMLVGESEFCLRAQVLSLVYKQLQGEQVQVGLMRIFEQGNAMHEKWQRLFIRAGYGKATDMDYTRYYKDYMLSYTPDIVCYIPEFFKGKMIGEIKSVNTYTFKKMSKHASAWKQCQWYMHLCIQQAKLDGTWNGVDYTKGFVLNDDKNTQEFKIEIYPYTPALVEPFAERADSIMYNYEKLKSDHKMVKRPDDATSPNCKRCSKCAMKDACWNVGQGKVKIK